jgi:hypothetical protein
MVKLLKSEKIRWALATRLHSAMSEWLLLERSHAETFQVAIEKCPKHGWHIVTYHG